MSYSTPLVSVNGASLTGDISQGVNNFINAKNQADEKDLRKQQLAGAQKQQEQENAQKQGEFDLKKQKAEGEKKNQGLIQQAASVLTNPAASTDQKNQAAGTLGQLAPETLKAIQGHLGAQEGKMEQSNAKMIYSIAGDLRNTPYAERQAKIDNVVKTLPPNSPLQAQLLSLKGLPEDQQNVALSSAQKAVLPLAEQAKLDNPDKTPLEKQAIAAGYKPGTPEYQKFITDAVTKSGVTINNKAETAESVELAKVRAKEHGNLQEIAQSADQTLSSVEQLRSLDVKAGALEPLKTKLGAIAESLGATDLGKEIGNISDNQAAEAIVNRLTLAELAKQKGVATDADRDFARHEIGNLGDTPRGREFKLNTLEANDLSQREQYDFIENQLQQGKNLAEANSAWRKEVAGVPIVSRTLRVGDNLPMYYYQFKNHVKSRDENATDESIKEAWLQANGKIKPKPKEASADNGAK